MTKSLMQTLGHRQFRTNFAIVKKSHFTVTNPYSLFSISYKRRYKKRTPRLVE